MPHFFGNVFYAFAIVCFRMGNDNMTNICTARMVKIHIRAAAVLLAAAMLLSAAVSCRSGGGRHAQEGGAAESMYVFEDQADYESLDAFIQRFVKWYFVRSGEPWQYDSSTAADGKSNILACIATPASCVAWELYSDVPQEDCFVEKPNDPEKWAAETNAYYMYDKATVDFIAREIFNVSEEDIQTLAEQGEKNRVLYQRGDKYYTLHEGSCDSAVTARIQSVRQDGDRFTVRFNAAGARESVDHEGFSVLSCKCSAEMELKILEGKSYWSLYRFDSENL